MNSIHWLLKYEHIMPNWRMLYLFILPVNMYSLKYDLLNLNYHAIK